MSESASIGYFSLYFWGLRKALGSSVSWGRGSWRVGGEQPGQPHLSNCSTVSPSAQTAQAPGIMAAVLCSEAVDWAVWAAEAWLPQRGLRPDSWNPHTGRDFGFSFFCCNSAKLMPNLGMADVTACPGRSKLGPGSVLEDAKP